MRTHLSIHYFSNSISNGSCKIQKNKKNSIHHKKKKRFHKNNSLATHSRKSPRDHRKGLAPTDTLPRVKRLPNVPSWQPRATVSRTCTVIARSCRRDSQAWKLDEKRLEMKSFFSILLLKNSISITHKTKWDSLRWNLPRAENKNVFTPTTVPTHGRPTKNKHPPTTKKKCDQWRPFHSNPKFLWMFIVKTNITGALIMCRKLAKSRSGLPN